MQRQPSKKAISFHQFLQRVKRFISLSEDYLEETTFYVFRTDTHQVLARGLDGYEAAKSAANRIRSSLGLKWDQVAFKKETVVGAFYWTALTLEIVNSRREEQCSVSV